MSQSEISRRHYIKNREVRRAEIKRRMQSVLNFVRGFKAGSWCLKCGERESCCLDFHHRDPQHKEFLVSTMARRGFSIRNVLIEIIKCDILCANCHRKLHLGME